MNYKVFVYGTLKRGFDNHTLLRKAEFLGKAKTVNKMQMLSLGLFPMVTDEQSVSIIYGEVYNIDKKTLNELDMLEGHPNFYTRKTTDIVLNNTVVKAIVYLKGKKYHSRDNVVVHSGEWKKEK